MRISVRRPWIAAGLAILAAVPWAAAQQTITPTAKELNKAFDADASQWTARFEHEGRAIYDKRYFITGQCSPDKQENNRHGLLQPLDLRFKEHSDIRTASGAGTRKETTVHGAPVDKQYYPT